MKPGMCNGCDNLTKTPQKHFWNKAGNRLLKKPYTTNEPYCIGIWGYGIHVCYVDRINEGKAICPRYRKDGMT